MSKRLPGHDYSLAGFYFVTICVQQHRLVFGTIVDDQIFLKLPGQIAESVLVTLPKRFARVKLHDYIFTPNHMHTIIELTDIDPKDVNSNIALWQIVRAFKAVTTYQIRRADGQPWFEWQDGYYDSIIRTEEGLQQIRHYIHENPQRWSQDKLYKRY